MSDLPDSEKVRLLLLSMDDYIESPKIWNGYHSALPGAQASSYVPCEVCEASGRLKNQRPCTYCLAGGHIEHFCEPCDSCEGRKERKWRKGDPEYDPYTGKLMDDVLADREADALKHAPVRRSKPFSGPETIDLDEDPHWRRKARHEAQGSYVDLRLRLIELARSQPFRYDDLMLWLSMPADRIHWSGHAKKELERTFEILARAMSKPIRIPRHLQPHPVISAQRRISRKPSDQPVIIL